ncbi:hypothetical protein GGR56DRAFT_353686 [Xylariaceae sp. FL0804]|nr:hypothetical protein GGR56DRAFT_353686 [Xylariaceae sp. FL0804]
MPVRLNHHTYWCLLEFVVTWLITTAKSHGDPVEDILVDSPSPGTHFVPLGQLERLAEFVSGKQKVPEEVLYSIDQVVGTREKMSKYHPPKEAYDYNADVAMKALREIVVLRKVQHIFQQQSLPDPPTPLTDHTWSDQRYIIPRFADETRHAWLGFHEDISALRLSLVEYWQDFVDDKMSLIAAATLTDVGLKIMRSMCEDFAKDFPEPHRYYIPQWIFSQITKANG